MIGHLHGTVIDITGNTLIVSVGGVGYQVACKDTCVSKTAVERHISLFTHLAVRETALDLYGFETKQELEFFQLLITISGIGPKVGLSILNAATPQDLYTAISKKDTSVLTKVSGIGKKNAEKIVLELENKITVFSGSFNEEQSDIDMEVFEALESLGYDARSIQSILKDDSLSNLETSSKIKQAIKLLGK